MAKSTFMMASINTEAVAALIRQCAREIVLPYRGKLEDHQKSYKGENPQNIFTEADLKSEEFLTSNLIGLLPESYVLGEEASESDPSAFDYLQDPDKSVWVIDPIDGTNNFVEGSPTFCIIVALVADGQTQMGWIYDICNDSMAFAQKNNGAFIDGVKITRNDHSSIEDSIQGFSRYRKLDHHNISVRNLRCSGLEYFAMAKGEADFSASWGLSPWDHLAGALLVQESGGCAAQWNGQPYTPDNRQSLIVAKNQAVWQRVREAIPLKIVEKCKLLC